MKRITKEGIQEMEVKLRDLQREKVEVIARKQQARSYGDLRENSEYQEATTRLSEIENEIGKIQSYVNNSVLMEETVQSNQVILGSYVTVKNLSNNMEKKYRIVDEVEADFMKGKLAYNSPFAQSILHKKVNDIVQYKNPMGVHKYQILQIL